MTAVLAVAMFAGMTLWGAWGAVQTIRGKW